jgi:hypothetical protein
MANKKKPARRGKRPLWIGLLLREAAPGLLCDIHAETLNGLQDVIDFAKREGIDPKAEGFWPRLALHLLRKHEPAFRAEPRGRPAAEPSNVLAAQLGLVELYIAENVPRIEEGLKPLSDTKFVGKYLSRAGRQKLPSYYRAKPGLKERTLRQELSLARGKLALRPDVRREIMNQFGIDEIRLRKAANFGALHRPKRAGGKVGEK